MMSKIISNKRLRQLLKESVELRKIAGIDKSGKSAPFGTGMKQVKKLTKKQKEIVGHT